VTSAHTAKTSHTDDGLEVYIVGGAVRDEMLGLPVRDRDYVVVGASPEQMVALGYRPVGRDFPVFLHPQTHEEYALARTERKLAPGYHGFSVHASAEVTLEEDLQRRDLTINAMARAASGALIDPYNGAEDLSQGVLRHVSPAFVEDPVRILRVARFAARFDFTIAPETAVLMQQMVEAGEVDFLVAERVWQELATGLQEARPSTMLSVLHECGALARVLPQLADLFAEHGMSESLAAVDATADQQASLEVRFAALMRQLEPEALIKLCERMRAPAACRELAVLAARHANAVLAAEHLSAEEAVAVADAADAWRRPERWLAMVQAAVAGEVVAGGSAASVRRYWSRLHQAGMAVVARDYAKQQSDPASIKAAVSAARVAAVQAEIAGGAQ